MTERKPRRRIHNAGSVLFLILLTVPCLGGAVSVMPYTPWAGWMMYALMTVTIALMIDLAVGAPLLHRYVDWSWNRRQRKG